MHRMFSLRNLTAACTLALLVILAPVAEVNLTATQVESTSSIEAWQVAELQTLVDVVGAALDGELVQHEDPFTFKSDFLKGMDGVSYVPFTVTLAPESLSESSVAMYVYVTPHVDEQAVAPEPPDELTEGPYPRRQSTDDGRLGLGLPTAVFEDAFFIDVSAAKGEDGPIVLSRAFTAVGGPYDVYVAIRDSMGELDAGSVAQAPPVLMVKSEVEVPDFWNGQLQTSSVIVAEVVEPLEQPLTPEEQSASPYSLGTARVVPRQDSNFAKTDELSLVMLVYNPTLTANQMPNLTIEYDFHTQSDAGEKFFNRTNSQEFNDETLPPGFDVSGGHQLVAGQSIPLAGFPEGAFRLQITVTDNAAGTSLVRDVNFNVSQ